MVLQAEYGTILPTVLILHLGNFHLFGPYQKQLAGKWFATDAHMKQAVLWLHTLDTDFDTKIRTLMRGKTNA